MRACGAGEMMALAWSDVDVDLAKRQMTVARPE